MRKEAASRLRDYVVAQNRELSVEAFSKFMSDLNKRIFELVNSDVLQDKIGGVLVIERLIDTHYDENVHVFTRFANHLRTVLSVGPGTESKVMVMASRGMVLVARALLVVRALSHCGGTQFSARTPRQGQRQLDERLAGV